MHKSRPPRNFARGRLCLIVTDTIKFLASWWMESLKKVALNVLLSYLRTGVPQ